MPVVGLVLGEFVDFGLRTFLEGLGFKREKILFMVCWRYYVEHEAQS